MDVWELIWLANRHPRVNIFQPGPGVRGHCIAVALWFIVSSTPDVAQLIRTERQVNDNKPDWVVDKVRAPIRAHLMENPGCAEAEITVAVDGLAFKPDIDGLHESPALDIACRLAVEHEGPLLVVEPNIKPLPKGLESLQLVDLPWARSADLHMMLVDNKEFKSLPRPDRALIDVRDMWWKIWF